MALGSRYHLFKRRVLVKGKRVIRWYYWYADESGKRVQKSTKCPTRAKAEALLEQLDREAERPAVTGELSLEAFIRSVGFFGADCPYLNRRREKDGVELKPHTIYIHRHNLEKYVIPMFGSLALRDIDGVIVEEGLLGLDRSSAARNLIIQTLRIVLREAVRRKHLEHVPEMEQFRRQSKRYDTLTDGELERLFPEEQEALRELWRHPRYPDEPYDAGIMFGVMFCVMVSAGLRSGEARALHREQIYPEHHGIVIDRAFDSSDKLSFPKKGTSTDLRFRAVRVPARTIRALSLWLPLAPEEGPIFTYRGHFITRDYLLDRWDIGIERAGILTEGRRLRVHSLRYTYVTRMRALVPEDLLREMVGHRSEEMTDRYTRPHLLERLQTHEAQQGSIERFWSSGGGEAAEP